jgi:hypothetical protein
MMLLPAADKPISSTQAFREVIAEAELGCAIAVAADVTLELESLDLADCDLTIRGGVPRRVLRLICDESAQRQSLFWVAGFLQLEDLSLQLVRKNNPANSSAETDDGDAVRCLIDLDGGSLVLSGCRLGAEGDSACLQAGGGSQLELLDCQLHAPQGCVIDWKPAAGGEATAVSTIFSGRTAWAITDPVDASLVLERITAIVDRLAEIRMGLPADELFLSCEVGRVGSPAAVRQNAAHPTCGRVFLASPQTASQFAVPGAAAACRRHRSEPVDVDHGQLVERRAVGGTLDVGMGDRRHGKNPRRETHLASTFPNGSSVFAIDL